MQTIDPQTAIATPSVFYDWEKLKIKYYKEVKKNSGNSIFNVILILIALFMGMALAPQIKKNSNIQLWINDREERRYEYEYHTTVDPDDPIWNDNKLKKDIETADLVIVLLSISTISMLVMFFLNASPSEFSNIDHKELSRDAFKPIWTVLDEYTVKMSLTNFTVRLIYLKTDSYEAYSKRHGNTINLYLSRSIVNLFTHNEYYFRAIIVHELAHIAHKDKRFLIISNKVFMWPAIIMMVAFILSTFNSTTFKAYTGEFGLIVFNFTKMLYRRQNAEHLADAAALVYLEKDTMVQVVQKLVGPKPSIWYPSKNQRVFYLNHLLKGAIIR